LWHEDCDFFLKSVCCNCQTPPKRQKERQKKRQT